MRFKSILGLCIFLSSTVLWAQTISTSQIRGTIQDPSGAAVAGAQVRLTQTATGAVRTATSGADGATPCPIYPWERIGWRLQGRLQQVRADRHRSCRSA